MVHRKKNRLTPNQASEWAQILVTGKSIESKHFVTDRGIRRRLTLMAVGLVLLFSVLIVRLFSVTIASAQNFRNLANGNRVRQTIIYAPRGKIMDRNGLLLADNDLSFQLIATPYLLNRDQSEFRDNLATIAGITGVGSKTINDIIVASGIDYVLPIVVEESLTHEQALRLEAKLPDLLGFSVDQIPIRKYRSDSALAQVVGYSGRVSEYDLNDDKSGNLLPTDYIGKVGAELSFDERLRGQNGWLKLEVDALGRPVRVIDKKSPEPGEDIYLSIDYELQKTLAKSILVQMDKSNTDRAAGVAVNPENGQVLAMVSLPSYDNNLFSNGISSDDFSKLNSNSNQPLFNKALTGGFTTGSIIKPLVASAGLQEGVIDENTVIVDRGSLTLPGGYVFLGWRPEGLGPMNVRSAISWSSNIFFYTVGGGFGNFEGLGVERLTKHYRDFGLGEQSGINLPNDAVGRVPDAAWKMANTGEAWYQGDNYNIAIGQGDILVSPLQITMAESSIANNGYLLTPQIEKGAPREVRREVEVDKKYLQIVREGMRGVLTGGTTCECTFSGLPVEVAGKSGTAETNTPGGVRPNAWFTSFAPYDKSYKTKPTILATVLIEEGAGGSLYAAPAIAETFRTYYQK